MFKKPTKVIVFLPDRMLVTWDIFVILDILSGS